MNSLTPTWTKNDKRARVLILLVSAIVFIAVVALKYLKVEVDLGFDVHLISMANAIINGTVACLLVVGLITVKMKKYALHKRVMLWAMALSVLFLVCYISYHLLTEETKFPEGAPYRSVYLFVLGTHIVLAGLILPFILFAAYRALIGEYVTHKRMVRYTWPIWFYVAVTGVVVYLMIRPYYA